MAKNKRNIATLLLWLSLIVVSFLGYYLSQRSSDTSSSIDTRDRKFAVEDRESIAKILIAQRNGRKMVLERRGADWFANGDNLVHPNFMGNMLDVVAGMSMKYIPPRSAYDNMMRAIGEIGVKVELYDKDGGQLKSYQVGGTTAGELGTVFLMDGYAQPYVMELKNFEGSLRGRFLIDDVDQIRDRTVLSYMEDEIKAVSVNYPKDNRRSFRLEMDETGKYEVKPYSPDGYAIKGTVKAGTVERFLRSFQDLDAEAFENEHPLRDSIRTLVPIAEVFVTNMEGAEKGFRLFSLIDVFNPDINTRTVGTDKRVERYFADCSWGEFMVVQDRLFNKVLWKYEEFY